MEFASPKGDAEKKVNGPKSATSASEDDNQKPRKSFRQLQNQELPLIVLSKDAKPASATDSPTISAASLRAENGDLVIDRIRDSLCALAESDNLRFRAKRLQDAEDVCKKLYELPTEWKSLFAEIGKGTGLRFDTKRLMVSGRSLTGRLTAHDLSDLARTASQGDPPKQADGPLPNKN